MNMISMEDISKTVKDEPLFEGVSLGIEDTDRIGLLGKNGCGKSTLLRLLSKELVPDTGTIAFNNQLHMSMLEQVHRFDPSTRVRDFLFSDINPRIAILKAYMDILEDVDADPHLYQELHDKMDAHACWDIEHSYQSLLAQMGIQDPDALLTTFSGGMVKKVALARSLATKPNLLLLDEPTNHLDISMVEWLEEYLTGNQIALVMVTHDRYILDAVCDTIWEIDQRRLYSYQGNYSTFLEQRAERIAFASKQQQKLASILRDEMQWLARSPKARGTKNKLRVQKVEEMLSQRVQSQEQERDFYSTERRLGKKVLEIRGLSKQYGQKLLFEPFSHTFTRGERIGLLGPNGSGKSSLLDILAGRVEPSSGSLDVGVNTRFAYYDQSSTPLKEELTVLEYLQEIAETVTSPNGTPISAAQFLERFNFPSSMHRLDIRRLSGGERRRLLLVSLLITDPNFLLLDEPTNDLDLDTLRKLEEYLLQFSGCLLVVSHDRAFLDRVTDGLFILSDGGRLEYVTGSYSQWAKRSREKETKASRSQDRPKERVVNREKKKGLSYKQKQELEELTDRIEQSELRKEELEKAFADPGKFTQNPQELSEEYERLSQELERDMVRWEELAELESES